MSEWQPIETAPIQPLNEKQWFLRHSPRVLLADAGGTFVYTGSYGYTQRGKGRWQNEMTGHNANPSHWMPLPPVPNL